MFSYWTYHGVPYNSTKEEDGEWRDNFFYKGSRFSDANLKANFYKPFNVISDHCKSGDQSNAPVDFFVRHTREAKRKRPEIDISQLVFIPATYPAGELRNRIELPIRESFVGEPYYAGALKNLIEGLYEQKAEKDKCTEDTKRLTVANSVKQLLESYLAKAFTQIKEVGSTKVHELLTNLSKIFLHLNPESEAHLYEVFCLIICYQFYDHDGITYLFLPRDADKSHCCLGILIPFGNESIVESHTEDLINLINALSPMPVLEKEIFENVKKNIILKYVWKAHYLSKVPLYESLCSHIYVLLKYICREAGIKVLNISYRVKDFESFYDRAVDRFNEPSKFKIEGHDVKAYRENFYSGSPASADLVFSKFWDLSGVRVLCVFKDDMERVKQELCRANNPADLNDLANPFENDLYGLRVNFIDKRSQHDYRAEHFILGLGSKRKELQELRELSTLLCEVQVKTILSQGWSDADHDLFYKSDLPPSKREEILPTENQVGSVRSITSHSLDDIDDRFVNLKATIQQILNEEL